MKYINPRELRDTGILQEVNRVFFHPLGLALTIHLDDIGGDCVVGVQDAREDPEGFNFSDDDPPEQAKMESVQKLLESKIDARLKTLGYVVQPVK